MAYCQGPYQLLVEAPPSRSILRSSRKIDFEKGDYVVDTDNGGGFESMPSTAQRVALLVIHALHGQRDVITAPQFAAAEDRVRKALAAMVAAKEIRIDSIDISRVAAGRVDRVVNFTDLTSREALNTEKQL